MADFAVINSETGIVENVVVLDDVNAWTPPEGCEVKPLGENVGIGWTWADGQWIEPPAPEPEPEQEPDAE